MARSSGLPPAAICERIVADHVYGCVALDREGRVRFANPAAERLTGRTIGEGEGTSFADYLDPASVQLAWQLIEEQDVRGDFGLPMVWAVRRPDGGTVHLEVGAHLYFDEPGFDGMVLRLRPYDSERCFEHFVASLARLESIERTLGSIVRWLEILLGDGRVAVTWGWNGRCWEDAVSSALPAALDGTHCDGEPVPPWVTAAVTRKIAVAEDLTALPEPIATEAAALGLEACWALPVSIPPDDDLAAAMVMWRRTPGGPFLSHSGALDQAVAACALTFERQRSDLLLRRSARTDGLTGVANRVAFFEQLARASAGRPEGTAVLYLDLDGFKQVNDGHGHLHGDRALCAVADALGEAVGPPDLLARLGGDEFAVLCPAVTRRSDVEDLADRLVAAVRSIDDVDGVPLTLGLSIGVALGADLEVGEGNEEATDRLVGAADRALYRAKALGGGWQVASPG
jgi:diguanylate cyclase (GGDEF)-like protein